MGRCRVSPLPGISFALRRAPAPRIRAPRDGQLVAAGVGQMQRQSFQRSPDLGSFRPLPNVIIAADTRPRSAEQWPIRSRPGARE
jgi:hypothetical protein